MSTNHTPGPWFHNTSGYPHADVKAANGRNIACTWGVNNQPKTKDAAQMQAQVARANARLIAAAPDLLEALQGFMAGAEAMGWDTAKARAAIAKATGSER